MTIYAVLFNSSTEQYKFLDRNNDSTIDSIVNFEKNGYKIYEKYLSASDEVDAERKLLKIRGRKGDLSSYKKPLSKLIRFFRGVFLLYTAMCIVSICGRIYFWNEFSFPLSDFFTQNVITIITLIFSSVAALLMQLLHKLIYKEPAFFGLKFKKILIVFLIIRGLLIIGEYMNITHEIRAKQIQDALITR